MQSSRAIRMRLSKTIGLAASAIVAAGLFLSSVVPNTSRAQTARHKGYGITRSGLIPRYPEGYECSPLTSLYASWKDVDGSGREERHSGIDGGRLGDEILAPAPGVIKAVWQANWGWGKEGAILIRHSRADLNLDEGPPFYYSAFYHLRYDDVRGLKAGRQIKRGQVLARVFRPGGKTIYLPEVHLEVYEVDDDDAMQWDENEHGARYWENEASRLIDPLYMLSRQHIPLDNQVVLEPFVKGADYSAFRGFTYILPCVKL